MPIIVAQDDFESYATNTALRAVWVIDETVPGGFGEYADLQVSTINTYQGARCMFIHVSGGSPWYLRAPRLFTGLDPAKTYTARVFVYTDGPDNDVAGQVDFLFKATGFAVYSSAVLRSGGAGGPGQTYREMSVVFIPNGSGNVTLEVRLDSTDVGTWVGEPRVDYLTIEEAGTIIPPPVTPAGQLVFVPEPNWLDSLKEEREYFTDIHTAYNDKEMRVQLASLPTRRLKYEVTTMTERETSTLQSWMRKRPTEAILLPWWHDAQPLLANVSIGASSVSVTTTDRDFKVGEFVLLRTDQFTFEVVKVLTVAAGSLTLDPTTLTTMAWTANQTEVVPLKHSFLNLQQKMERPIITAAITEIEGETDARYAIPTVGGGTWTSYRSFHVLDWYEPNRDEDPDESWARTITQVRSPVGVSSVYDHGGTPITARPFRFLLDGRAEVNQLRQFFDARLGRKVGVWVPTWNRDMVLTVDVASGATTMTIEKIEYTLNLLAETARKDVVFLRPGLSNLYRRITGAVDNGNGTETLTISSSPGAILSAATTMVCFLVWCRLDSDLLEIEWHGRDLATAELKFVELPREVP